MTIFKKQNINLWRLTEIHNLKNVTGIKQDLGMGSNGRGVLIQTTISSQFIFLRSTKPRSSDIQIQKINLIDIFKCNQNMQTKNHKVFMVSCIFCDCSEARSEIEIGNPYFLDQMIIESGWIRPFSRGTILYHSTRGRLVEPLLFS